MIEAASHALAMRFRRHWWALLAIALSLAALTAAAAHVALVRLDYGVWTWTPGEDTPSIPFDGRHYLRGRLYPGLPAGVERIADGPVSSGIYSQSPITGYAPTGLYLRFPDGHVTGYALAGGP